jgi:hypothetical protein
MISDMMGGHEDERICSVTECIWTGECAWTIHFERFEKEIDFTWAWKEVMEGIIEGLDEVENVGP